MAKLCITGTSLKHIIGSPIRALLLVMLLVSWTGTFGQQWPFEMWHEGRIVLLTGDTLKGQVKYDPQQDIVQFTTSSKTVDAFSARKVLFFEIYDVSVRRYRQFFALPYSSNGSYRAPVFFELLEDGKITLLSREALEYRSFSYGFYGGTYSRLVLVNKYFFMDEQGEIAEFKGNKSDLLDKMERKAEDVEKYIRVNRLKFDDKYDFSKIVAYYNSLYGT
jgi:hypothetical protein